MQIFQFVLYFTSGIVQLTSNHLLPGVPHHIFLLFLGPGFGHILPSSKTLLLRVCLEEMESKHRQRRHRHYQQLLSVLASLFPTRIPREKFNSTPSTFRHGTPLRFLKGPVRCSTAAVVLKDQMFIFHTEFKKGKCRRLFFPEFPAGREIANRDARAPAT